MDKLLAEEKEHLAVLLIFIDEVFYEAVSLVGRLRERIDILEVYITPL